MNVSSIRYFTPKVTQIRAVVSWCYKWYLKLIEKAENKNWKSERKKKTEKSYVKVVSSV